MVILGLGSNLGDRLHHLRLALAAIQRLPDVTVQQISPVYLSDAMLPDEAPADWNKPYLNFALRCETRLTPHELLAHLKQIEESIGRKPAVRHWGPRIVDIDILVWENLVLQDERLTIPQAKLEDRPFALWPIADLAPRWVFPAGACSGQTVAAVVTPWGSRLSGKAPFKTRQIPHRVETPALVGILNVTPDSFSDGGCYASPEKALKQAEQLVEAGADVLDIGAESTSPTASPIDPKTEWQRLQPILSALKSIKHRFTIPPKISVDTYHPAVAQQALAYDIDWINDVSGLTDPLMQALAANTSQEWVIMHQLGLPVTHSRWLPPEQDPVALVYEWAARHLEQLEKAGIVRERLILDPGIGFGKTASQSLALIQRAAQFKPLGTRLLIGHSRKSFLTLFTDKPHAERDIETVVMSLHLAKSQIDYLRVHDVDLCSRGLKVAAAL